MRVLAGIFVIATALGLVACSLIFDADDFRGSPDAFVADARLPDAAPPTDSNPAGLQVTGVTPEVVWEGQGSIGRPLPLVVSATNLIPEATISVAVAGAGDAGVPAVDVQVGETTTCALPHDCAATTLSIPVSTDIGQGDELTLEVTVTQAGTSASTELTLRGLDELSPAAGDYAASDFLDRYSRIDIDEDIHLVGDAPVRLRATSEIVVAADVSADGAPGTTATGGAPGAGGCAGGDQNAPGGCGDGAGGAGSAKVLNLGPGGGGGGGFGADGNKGTGGENGGPEGGVTGNRWLVPLATEQGAAGNRGNGGGGGADGTLSSGGGGGGGGGVVELASEGRIDFGAGSVHAAGGVGGGGTGGGGGGGSGGALLLRAHAGIVRPASEQLPLAAPGGTGGSGGENDGGAGGVGRVRVDYPGQVAPDAAGAPAPVRGPMWAADTPVVVTDAEIDVTLHGEGATEYGILVNDASQPEPASTNAAGTHTARIALEAGRNRICAVTPDDNFALPEAVNCIDVAYIPQSP